MTISLAQSRQRTLALLRLSRSTRAFIYRCIGKSSLSEQQKAALIKMRQDNSRAGNPFVASGLWQEISRQFENLFTIEGIGHVENQPYNHLFSQPDPTHPRNYRYALWMLYCHVLAKDYLNLIERLSPSASHQSETALLFNGRAISWDFLISINTLYNIAEVDDRIFHAPIVVADLGAGWGRLLYLLKRINPACTGLIFDLPEPLLISMNYLPTLLPDENYCYYEDVRKIPEISARMLEKGGIWFCGSQDLARFEDKSIDIFINIASFQEMTRQQVGGYFNLIDAKVSHLLYLQQYWGFPAYKDKFDLIAGFDDYPFPPHWKEQYKRNVIFSDLYFETVFSME